LKVLTKERDDLNENAREFKKVRDELNASIKENLDKALKYRDERDKINQKFVSTRNCGMKPIRN